MKFVFKILLLSSVSFLHASESESITSRSTASSPEISGDASSPDSVDGMGVLSDGRQSRDFPFIFLPKKDSGKRPIVVIKNVQQSKKSESGGSSFFPGQLHSQEVFSNGDRKLEIWTAICGRMGRSIIKRRIIYNGEGEVIHDQALMFQD